MNEKKTGSKAPPAQARGEELSREERLAAALRANLARRKAQSRARAAGTGDDEAEGED